MGRITPACAGNRCGLDCILVDLGDHPRVCGEQPRAAAAETVLSGSPPRVRGTERKQLDRVVCRRITPACAGNRRYLRFRRSGLKDHPRVCGEQTESKVQLAKNAGSPPRVRGTVPLTPIHGPGPRITPACAGNSSWKATGPYCPKDHPRVCGEQASMQRRRSYIMGSPPRVRGTGYRNICSCSFTRITPACAGNRLKKARHFYILFCQIKRIHLV